MKGFTREETRVYRALQKHLDRQPVGFPATISGAELRFLRRLFTPEEAKLALHLSYRPAPLAGIMETAGSDFSIERAAELLESLIMKGSIGFRGKAGAKEWFLLPMVVGMYEAQDGRPTRSFLRDAGAYMKTLAFGRSFLAARPSQMRTIPINVSIPVEHPVATYDQVSALLENSPGPFVILPCICREAAALQGRPCSVTDREETCLGMGSVAAMVLHRGHGREIDREEALRILDTGQQEGLVLQPSNTRDAEFICSCCGCCCGMLQLQRKLPRPADMWVSSYRAEVDPSLCTGCGVCARRCQVEAVSLRGSPPGAEVSEARCIGCGLCVPSCPAGAVRLVPAAGDNVPPKDSEDLYETIMRNRKGRLGTLATLVGTLVRRRR